MPFYLSIIFAATMVALIANNYKSNKYVFMSFYLLSAVILFIPLAARGMGIDIENYKNMYTLSGIGWNSYWSQYGIGFTEPFFMILVFASRYVFHSFQWVNILSATLSIIFSFLGFYRFKDKINVGIAIWTFSFNCYIFMYGLNRMMIAVPMCLCAYPYIKSKSFKKYIIWILCAFMFHYSAALMILVYFMVNWLEKNNGLVLKKLFIIILTAVLFLVVFKIAELYFSKNAWFYKYFIYLDSSINFAEVKNQMGVLPIFLIMLLARKRFVKDKDTKYLYLLCWVGVLFTIVTIFLPIHRIVMLIYPCCCILYALVPEKLLKTATTREDVFIGNKIIYDITILLIGTVNLYKYIVYSPYWAPSITPYFIGEF